MFCVFSCIRYLFHTMDKLMKHEMKLSLIRYVHSRNVFFDFLAVDVKILCHFLIHGSLNQTHSKTIIVHNLTDICRGWHYLKAKWIAKRGQYKYWYKSIHLWRESLQSITIFPPTCLHFTGDRTTPAIQIRLDWLHYWKPRQFIPPLAAAGWL